MPVQASEPVASSTFDQFLDQYLHRDLLRFTTAGSVDDGKSTLIGRLLYDSKAVYEDQVQSIRKSKLNRSTGPIDFSLLTDGLRAEREQGITIDVAYRYFSTPRRKFIIADTPGHEQYTRNMATGASTADAAVVLVDARKGVLPQSRRHATIAALLGIPHIIAAVNKMDLVDYSEEVFLGLQADLDELLQQISPSGAQHIHSIPLSALEGENVVRRGTKMPWYSGASLLEYLEELPIAASETPEPFRFPVQYVIRPDDSFRGFAGQIIGGSVRPGDHVIALPSRQKTRIRSIVTYDGSLPHANAGSSITLQLEDELDLSRGDFLVSDRELPCIAKKFAANVVWLHDSPLDLTKRWIMRQTTNELRVQATYIRSRIDVNTMERSAATRLGLNDIGIVEFEATHSFPFDLYTQNRSSGSFILIDPLTNATMGAGMILESLEEEAPVDIALNRAPVGTAEREARNGHSPAVVWLGSQKQLALRLERILFDAGFQAIAIDDAGDAEFLSEALIPVLFATGMLIIYGTAKDTEQTRQRLDSIVPADRILDVEKLEQPTTEEDMFQKIQIWAEELRLFRARSIQ